MDLNKLVPPLELCKLIPAGEFADSAFIWVKGMDRKPKVICRPWDKKSTAAPAPNVAEILDACKDIPGVLNPTLWYQAGAWIADCAYDRTEKLGEEFFTDEDFGKLDLITGKGETPATAAMKLWLKLKGIKYE